MNDTFGNEEFNGSFNKKPGLNNKDNFDELPKIRNKGIPLRQPKLKDNGIGNINNIQENNRIPISNNQGEKINTSFRRQNNEIGNNISNNNLSNPSNNIPKFPSNRLNNSEINNNLGNNILQNKNSFGNNNLGSRNLGLNNNLGNNGQITSNQVTGLNNNLRIEKTEEEINTQKAINIVSLMFFGLIIYDLWQMIILHKSLLSNIFIHGIGGMNVISSSTILTFFDFLCGLIISLIIFLPSIINKKYKSPIYLYSERIILNMKTIIKNGLFNIEENRDEMVKIIYFIINGGLIILFYHYSLNLIFFNGTFNLGKTLIFGFVLLGGITIFNNLVSKYILKVTQNNLVETRKEIFKILFALIFYSSGILSLLYGLGLLANNIYDFIISISWIHKFI